MPVKVNGKTADTKMQGACSKANLLTAPDENTCR